MTTAVVVAGSVNTDGTPSRKWWSLGNMVLYMLLFAKKPTVYAGGLTLSQIKLYFDEKIQFLHESQAIF
jgi:hypothetical protein